MPENAFHGIPVRLLANLPGAVEMRVANSAAALAGTEWVPYAAESPWLVPTDADGIVYVEFRTAEGVVSAIEVEIPPFEGGLTNYYPALPLTSAYLFGDLGGPLWSQDFEDGVDGWASDRGIDGGLIDRSPASWSSTGGTEGSGHVWIDDSRWASLALPGGPAILALASRVRAFTQFHEAGLDLSGFEARFALAADGLDLKGGEAYFWIEDALGLWRSAAPLALGEGGWTANAVLLAAGLPGDWIAMSGQLLPLPNFAAILGWGVALAGYDPLDPPTGTLRLDDFEIGALPSALPDVVNLDQSLSFDEGGAVLLQPILVDPLGDGPVTVTLRLSDPLAGTIEGAGFGAGIAGVYRFTGTALEANLWLAGLTFVPAPDRDLPAHIDVAVREGVVGSPEAVGRIDLVPTGEADAPAADGLDRTITYTGYDLAIGLGPIAVADPDQGAVLTVTLALSDPTAGILLGRVAPAGTAWVVTGSVAEVNRALATLSFLPVDGRTAPVSLALTVSDGTGTVDAAGTITLLYRENDAPSLTGGPFAVTENALAGTQVGTVQATDPDGDAPLFSLIDDGGGRFTITADGRVLVRDPALLDHELAATVPITVRVSDGLGGHTDATFTVSVADVVGETLIGGYGNETLRGGAGEDTLWSYVGYDTLVGGQGNDSYMVLREGTTIVELAGEGNADRAFADVSYALGAGVAVEILSTTDNLGTAALALRGNALANTLIGNAGANILAGGGGNDMLIGSGGADVYLFDSAPGAGNLDTIFDFAQGLDRIRLDDRVFTGLAAGALGADRFFLGAAATNAAHRIGYDPTSGLVYYDADGVGGAAAIAFAAVGAGLGLTAADFEAAHPLAASDLSPGQFLIDGVPGLVDDGFGGVPARLLANIEGAIEMRFGATRDELAGAEWRPYAAESDWLLRSSAGEQQVFAEFRLSNGTIRVTSALAPAYDPDSGTDYPLPHNDSFRVGDPDGMVWTQDFSVGSDRWVSYDYSGGVYGFGNVYYAASAASSGGFGDSAYIWTDDSRWKMDTPEAPDSVLALLTYPRWIDSHTPAQGIDLTDTIVEFHLRGEDLDLNGGQAYFWLTDSNGRWKYYLDPLEIGDGEWTFNAVSLAAAEAGDWEASFFYNGPASSVDFSNIHSFGIGFAGFDPGDEPSGVLALDEFVIRRAYAIGLDNADQRIVYASGELIAIAPITVNGPSPTALVTVSISLDAPGVGAIEGAGAGVDGWYSLSGTLAEVNAALAALAFRPSTDDVFTTTITVRVESGEATGATGHMTLVHGTNHAPLPLADALAGVEEVPLVIQPAELLGNDGDPDDHPLTIVAVGNAVNGGVLLNSDGTITFNPTPNVGQASFQYTVGDGQGGFATATATIILAGTNDPPIATDDQLVGDPDAPLVIAAAALLGNDIDIDLDALFIASVGNAVNGSVVLNPDGSVTFTPAPGHVGTASFDYVVDDGAGGTDSATVTIAIVDDPGTARPDSFAAAEDAAIGAGLNLFADNGAGADSDPDTPLVIGSVQGLAGNVGVEIVLPSGALLIVSADGSFDYDPNGAFDWLTPAGGGSSNASATDSFSYALDDGSSAVVTVTVTGVRSPGDQILGTAGQDEIVGTALDDVIQGLAGADTMTGLGGDDTYYIDTPDDLTVEAVGGGNDRVLTSVDASLSAGQHVETLATADEAGTAALALGGNELDNLIRGNAGANILYGKGGADTMAGLGGDDIYYVESASDAVIEAAGGGNDRIHSSVSYVLAEGQSIETLSTDWNAGTAPLALGGNAMANTIVGNNGDNLIYGKGGGDTLIGLGGDDTYYVLTFADLVNEGAGGGNDRIHTAGDYTLAAGMHVEILSTDSNAGTAPLALGGNELDNKIIGNAGANILYGKGGQDTMTGFGGDDFYYVDVGGDIVVEAAGGGNDRVFASGDYTLYDGVSVETLSTDNMAGTAALVLGGNELANTIIGNAGNNLIYGKGGADTMIGFGGDDNYLVDVAGDVVVESAGGGNDRIFTSSSYTLAAGLSVETLSTDWNAGTAALALIGNELANALIGNNGNNVLDGKGGGDLLTGLDGSDQFRFSTALGPGNVDTIVDFQSGVDKIVLFRSIFPALAPGGALLPEVFVVGTVAEEPRDRIVYNQATGALYYDADGNGAGAAVQFASLAPTTMLVATDFLIS